MCKPDLTKMTMSEVIRVRLAQPPPTLTTINVCGVDVDMTYEMSDQFDAFVKANNLPIEKLGAIGGEYTLCITPTSLGSVYVIRHSTGAELNLTPFETW